MFVKTSGAQIRHFIVFWKSVIEFPLGVFIKNVELVSVYLDRQECFCIHFKDPECGIDLLKSCETSGSVMDADWLRIFFRVLVIKLEVEFLIFVLVLVYLELFTAPRVKVFGIEAANELNIL